MDIFQLCDELEMNIVAKRHHSTKEWNCRVSHAWFHNPILSVTGATFEDCVSQMEAKRHAIENQRVGIERKNKLRQEKDEKARKNYNHGAETDSWYDRF